RVSSQTRTCSLSAARRMKNSPWCELLLDADGGAEHDDRPADRLQLHPQAPSQNMAGSASSSSAAAASVSGGRSYQDRPSPTAGGPASPHGCDSAAGV